MRLLLDTHVLLWWMADSPSLPASVKEVIDQESETYVSAATLWEIAIKQALGKILEPPDLIEQIRAIDFRQLPISFEHAVAAGRLPMIHRDPFDRMLIAQARCASLLLVSQDVEIRKYDVELLDGAGG